MAAYPGVFHPLTNTIGVCGAPLACVRTTTVSQTTSSRPHPGHWFIRAAVEGSVALPFYKLLQVPALFSDHWWLGSRIHHRLFVFLRYRPCL